MLSESGALVRARGREWVVLPDSTDDLLMLRPGAGSTMRLPESCRRWNRSSRPPSAFRTAPTQAAAIRPAPMANESGGRELALVILATEWLC